MVSQRKTVSDYQQILVTGIVTVCQGSSDQEPQPRPRDAAQVLLAAQRRIDNICHLTSVVVRNRRDEFNSMSMIFNDIHDILMIFIVMDNGNGASSPHGF